MIYLRIAKRLEEEGGSIIEYPRCNISFNPEIYKLVAQRMVIEADAELMTNTIIVDCRSIDIHLSGDEGQMLKYPAEAGLAANICISRGGISVAELPHEELVSEVRGGSIVCRHDGICGCNSVTGFETPLTTRDLEEGEE